MLEVKQTLLENPLEGLSAQPIPVSLAMACGKAVSDTGSIAQAMSKGAEFAYNLTLSYP